MTKPIFAAFDQGQVPTIVLTNKATVPMGVEFDPLVAALQKYVDIVSPIWGTPARIESGDTKPGCWQLVFLDDADAADALGYHALTPDGLPVGKVFVKTTLAVDQKVSVTASHELAEMLWDPGLNICYFGLDGIVRAGENADPCEDEEFLIDGIPMSDFVYPAYFEDFRAANSTKFDYMGKINAPLQILAGGYQSLFVNGQWEQRFGSEAKRLAFAKEDRRQHRTELRAKKPFPWPWNVATRQDVSQAKSDILGAITKAKHEILDAIKSQPSDPIKLAELTDKLKASETGLESAIDAAKQS